MNRNTLLKFISTQGYKDNSPDKDNPFNIIPPSNEISMQGVSKPLLGIDNLGNKQYMYPGYDYKFDGDYVIEFPLAQKGGETNKLEGDIISKILMYRNKDKDFVKRASAIGQYPNSNMFTVLGQEFGDRSSHLMEWGEDETGQAYMYPTIINEDNEAIKVPNQYANYISSEGYKKATGMKEYQNGGQPDTLFVSNPNDKRLLAYKDSLHINKNTLAPTTIYGQKPKGYTVVEDPKDSGYKAYQDSLNLYETVFDISKKTNDIYKQERIKSLENYYKNQVIPQLEKSIKEYKDEIKNKNLTGDDKAWREREIKNAQKKILYYKDNNNIKKELQKEGKDIQRNYDIGEGYQLKHGKNKYKSQYEYPEVGYYFTNINNNYKKEDYEKYLNSYIAYMNENIKLAGNTNNVAVSGMASTSKKDAMKQVANAKEILRLLDNDKIKPIGITQSPESLMYPVYKKPTKPIYLKGTEEYKNVTKQEELISAGYNIGEVDGVWGAKSQKAWDEYQNKSNELSEPIFQLPPVTVYKPEEKKPLIVEGERTTPMSDYPNVSLVYKRGDNGNWIATHYMNPKGERIAIDNKKQPREQLHGYKEWAKPVMKDGGYVPKRKWTIMQDGGDVPSGIPNYIWQQVPEKDKQTYFNAPKLAQQWYNENKNTKINNLDFNRELYELANKNINKEEQKYSWFKFENPNEEKIILKDSHKRKNGKPGIRNNSKIHPEIIRRIAEKAYKYNVPLEDALAVGIRESNLMKGDIGKEYNPLTLYQSWSSRYDNRLPKDMHRWIIDNNKIDKKYIKEDKNGTYISAEYKNNTNYDFDENLRNEYVKYVNDFNNTDYSVYEPFDREMKFLKNNMGAKYNSNEKDRLAKIEYEKRVIRENPHLMEYAKKYYKKQGGQISKWKIIE